MQNHLLNSRIESTLTLVVSVLSVALIAAGTFGMVRPTDTTVTVAALDPVVITSTRALARTATPADAKPAAL